MQPLFCSHSVVYGKIAAGTDEADVLQTDVMRFMAILGICLMIIFALVKAIPMAPPETPPVIETEDSVSREAQRLNAGIEPEKKQTVNIRKQKHAPVRQRKAAPAPPVENAAQEGFVLRFVLRFVSDAALTALIEKGTIRFYAMVGKTSRELRIKNGHTSYDVSIFPSSFYEMASRTVPDSYREALKKAVAVLGENVTWGVTLPEKIQKNIHMQMAGKEGGILVIHANGQVVYHRSEQEVTYETGD